MPDAAPTVLPIQNPARASAVQRQLERILKSPHFRTSKRAQDCLRFIVEHALEGDIPRLKERCIGTEVFGRDPAYDTGTDSIVRVTVNELRKKLAQYYVHAGSEAEIVIDLPAGSYMPDFLSAPETSEPAPLPLPPRTRRSRWTLALVGLLLLTGGAVTSLLLVRKPAADTTMSEFWSPLVNNPRPVLISIGNPLAWRRARHRDVTYYRLPDSRPPAEDGSPGNDFVPMPDQFFGVGDAMAGMSLVADFAKMGKAFEVRPGVDVSYGDLRSYPVVFVGFSDTLHLQIVKGLRFTLDMGKNVLVENNIRYDLPMIRDHVNPEKSWSLPNVRNDGKTDTDYLLISRVLSSEMGEPYVEAAGLTNYGSRAAGEFLSNPNYLRMATGLMPPDWPRKNLQIVCEVRVVGSGPTAPKVVAVHTW
jgi:hypothetical protein